MNRLRFNWRNIEHAPDDAIGVYSIWTRRVCIYVGKTDKQNLRSRLRQHYRNSHNESLRLWVNSSHVLWFSYEVIGNDMAIAAIERNRIKQYAPLANVLLRKKETQYGLDNTRL